MYEGAVELATLKEKDPLLMHRVTALIDNYGQVQTLSLGLPCGDVMLAWTVSYFVLNIFCNISDVADCITRQCS